MESMIRGVLLVVTLLPLLTATGLAAPFVYIPRTMSADVVVIDAATNTVVGAPIAVGSIPEAVAVNPAGTRLYVANSESDDVSVVDTATHTVIGAPIPVGVYPTGIAVNPAGTRVYVTSLGHVSVIDATTNTLIGAPIGVGSFPTGIVVNPAGTRVYVATYLSDSVAVIDTATNTVVGAPIPVGDGPYGIAINAAGARVYVANRQSHSVSVIDTATNTVVGAPIAVGKNPWGIAVNQAGTRVYVGNVDSNSVSVIDTGTGSVVEVPLAPGRGASGIALTPDGTRAYVANYYSDNVSVIDTATNTVVGAPIRVGNGPLPLGQFIGPASASHSGWWWNPSESGRGFFVEHLGNNLFVASYLYAEGGRATWVMSAGPMANFTTYAGDLVAFSGGQTLTGTYEPPQQSGSVGHIALSFNDFSHATLIWPGGLVPLQRFNFGRLGLPPGPGQPETGWWWNAAENGRGFSIEIQGGTLFIAGFMYDGDGNPTWYSSAGAMAAANRYDGQWLRYTGGQTLTGPYRPPDGVALSVGAISLQFHDAQNATLTLPDGRQISLTRFRF